MIGKEHFYANIAEIEPKRINAESVGFLVISNWLK